jgi:hypothetical protein
MAGTLVKIFVDRQCKSFFPEIPGRCAVHEEEWYDGFNMDDLAGMKIRKQSF